MTETQIVEELFTTISSIFGCASWKIEEDGTGHKALTTSCLACGIAKKLGAQSPGHWWHSRHSGTATAACLH